TRQNHHLQRLPTNHQAVTAAAFLPGPKLFWQEATNATTILSMLQRDGMQFFHRGAVVPKVIDGCSDGREGEGIEWCGDHGVQEVDSAYANSDVGDVVISAVLGNEVCDVGDERRDDVGILGCGNECRGR